MLFYLNALLIVCNVSLPMLTVNKGTCWKLHHLPSSNPILFLHFLSLLSMHTSILVDNAAVGKSMEVSFASRMTWVETLLCL